MHAAAVAYEVNAPLSFEDIHVAPPGPSEVRVKMMYAAVCQSDLFYMKGKVQLCSMLLHELRST